MPIEWNKAKRDTTLKERGLDFYDVATVDWDRALTAIDARKDYAEPRYLTIAPIKGRLCVFVWCARGKNIRVISLRKANDREKKRYAENND